MSLSLSLRVHISLPGTLHMLGWLLEIWSSCAFACLTDWILVIQNKGLLRILSVLLLQFSNCAVIVVQLSNVMPRVQLCKQLHVHCLEGK
jgi:hypothetical protein